MSFEDVSQIIRTHIYHKFHKWNPEKGKFSTWAKRVISNQIINIKKKNFLRFQSPCSDCPFNMGDNRCGQNPSGKKNEECEKFRKWAKTKASGQSLVSPASLDERYEDESHELKIQVSGDILDLTEATERLHKLMMATLKDNFRIFYELRYLKGLPDEAISLAFGFTTSEEGRLPGYRQIYNMEAEIRQTARYIVSTKDIFENY